jgi:dolichol-phosphate mannosyltransferase
VIVPCFNEGGTIAALSQKLMEFNAKFFGRFDSRFILVDDGSSDSTHRELLEHFGGRQGFLIIRHGENRGIAAAIMTGMRAAETEIVVSIDSDCTYDPLQIDRLLEKFDEQTAMVTASPYHPRGRVIGVPKWRLWLSRQASRKYRKAIGAPLHTFTSCFRAYRRSFFHDMELHDGGFVGIAEMLWLTIRRGGVVVEVPAELSTRKLGFSKLRTIPVIRKHLTLLRRIQRTPTAQTQSLPSERTTVPSNVT